MRNRYGWSNVIHEHDLPWVDRPDVYRIFFGDEGLVESGGEATWVPDSCPSTSKPSAACSTATTRPRSASAASRAAGDRTRAGVLRADRRAWALQIGTSVAERRDAGRLRQHAGRLRREVQVPSRGLAPSAADPGPARASTHTPVRPSRTESATKRTRAIGSARTAGPRCSRGAGGRCGVRYDWTQYPTRPAATSGPSSRT